MLKDKVHVRIIRTKGQDGYLREYEDMYVTEKLSSLNVMKDLNKNTLFA